MLLPSRFQPEALPSPGPAIRKPEPVKVDPIREFEASTLGIVGWPYTDWMTITEADCQQFKGAATARRSESTLADDGKVDTPIAAPEGWLVNAPATPGWYIVSNAKNCWREDMHVGYFNGNRWTEFNGLRDRDYWQDMKSGELPPDKRVHWLRTAIGNEIPKPRAHKAKGQP